MDLQRAGLLSNSTSTPTHSISLIVSVSSWPTGIRRLYLKYKNFLPNVLAWKYPNVLLKYHSALGGKQLSGGTDWVHPVQQHWLAQQQWLLNLYDPLGHDPPTSDGPVMSLTPKDESNTSQLENHSRNVQVTKYNFFGPCINQKNVPSHCPQIPLIFKDLFNVVSG